MAGSAANAIFLGHHLGSRDPHHINRWVNAMHAGRRAAIKCSGVTTSGARCSRLPMRQSCYCVIHQRQARPQDRDRAERRLEQQHADVLKFGGTAKAVREAQAGLRRLARLRLHRQWKLDPRVDGATIAFANDADRARVRDWIISNCGLDIDAPLADGRELTPRALDRCLWAGWRVIRGDGRMSDQFIENAKLRVKAAVRDDTRFWARWDALGRPDETVGDN